MAEQKGTCPSYKFHPARNPGVLGAPGRASLVAPKDIRLMARRDDLELAHGATTKARENAVKQDRVQATNAIKSSGKAWISAPDGVYRRDRAIFHA